MEKRFTALRIIGTIYKVLGLIIASITILGALGLCGVSVLGGGILENLLGQAGESARGGGLLGGLLGGFILALGLLIYGGGAALTLYAFGEGVYLLLALEENTRAAAEYLRLR